LERVRIEEHEFVYDSIITVSVKLRLTVRFILGWVLGVSFDYLVCFWWIWFRTEVEKALLYNLTESLIDSFHYGVLGAIDLFVIFISALG